MVATRLPVLSSWSVLLLASLGQRPAAQACSRRPGLEPAPPVFQQFCKHLCKTSSSLECKACPPSLKPSACSRARLVHTFDPSTLEADLHQLKASLVNIASSRSASAT